MTLRCEHCEVDAEPRYAWTCSGDYVVRMGAWCSRCGRFAKFIEPTRKLRSMTPPWRFIPLREDMPSAWNGVATKWIEDPQTSFDFGANVGRTETMLSWIAPKEYGCG